MAMLVRSVFERYDGNRNGVLDRDEWSGFRSDPSEADSNRDGRITQDEYSSWMASRFSGGGRGFGGRGGDDNRGGWGGGGDGDNRGGWGGDRGDRGDGGRRGDRGGEDNQNGSGAKVVTNDSASSLRRRTPTEMLPSGLPAWFARQDTNADGQVTMAEFASSWSERVVADFAQFDLDGDGIVTPHECLTAVEGGAVAGSSSLVSTESRQANGSSSADDRPSPATSSSTSGGSDGDRYLKYADSVV